MIGRGLLVARAVLVIAQLVVGSSLAEEQNVTASRTLVLLPGAITGVGSHGPMGYWRLCSPRSAALNQWQVAFVEHLLKPSDAQKEMLRKLAAASTVAMKAIKSSCPEETLTTGTVQVAAMERRVTGLLHAIKAIREPFEALYASLDNRQKALLDALGPSRRGWQW